MAVQLGYREVYRYPTGFPEWQANGLPVASAPAGTANATPTQGGLGLAWTLLGVFLGGMALNLTPCVYPIIPITVSYFGGRGGGKGNVLAHGLCYVGGLAVTNSLLGVAAALTGGLMGAALQNPVVLAAVAVVLLAFAASLFGFWEFRLPSGLTQSASRSFAGYFGSVFMGLTMGVVAAPCIGPFVLGLLTWVASSGSALLGFTVFFTLSLGLGLPLLVLALFSGRLERLPRAGEWMVWVRRLMGWVLVGMAVHFVRPLLAPDAGLGLLAVVALTAGVDLGWLARSGEGSRGFRRVRRAVGVLGLAIAVVLVGGRLLRGPGLSWRPYSEDLLASARRDGRSVIIDFSAAWCTPCRRLDEETFHDPQVVALATAEFVAIKVDLTRSGDPRSLRLLQQYAIKGVPTVVFLGPDGYEDRRLRLVDYLPPDAFLARMKQARAAE
ncbi:MAG TPA: cytochrome c biogenesis protein CcdA [bacterium]